MYPVLEHFQLPRTGQPDGFGSSRTGPWDSFLDRHAYRGARGDPMPDARIFLPQRRGPSRMADVAQLVEQLIRNQQVVSSSLTVGSNVINGLTRPTQG